MINYSFTIDFEIRLCYNVYIDNDKTNQRMRNMDILSIRSQLRTKSIYDIPLRVTFYARVSSESDEQLNSLDNQISYYEELIKKNKKWTYVPGYVDEGITAITTKKRKQRNNYGIRRKVRHQRNIRI